MKIQLDRTNKKALVLDEAMEAKTPITVVSSGSKCSIEVGHHSMTRPHLWTWVEDNQITDPKVIHDLGETFKDSDTCYFVHIGKTFYQTEIYE